jgi:hypothetical protein
MTTYIQQWIVAGSDHSPEALTARRQVYEALLQRKVDQLRFDQALYFASVHGSWLNEFGSQSQLTKAEADGKHELVARIVDGQRRRRISYGGWKLAMHAAHVNLRLSIDEFGKAIRNLSWKDGYALDTLSSGDIRAFLEEEEPGCEGFDETDRPLVYHMDSHRLQGVQREGVQNNDVAAIEQTYKQWLEGTLTDFSGGFGVAATTFTFVSWRTCKQSLVGVHLLTPFANLLRRYTKHGPDNPRARIPADVEHAYGMINEPQHQERLSQLEGGSDWDGKVMQPFVKLHHDRRRSQFIEKVDELQAFVRDLTAFNEQLLAFIALHRASSGVEGLRHPFEKLAAQYNLLAALSASSDVTRLIEELREALVRKYHLPRADRIRPLLNKGVYQVDDRYAASLEGLEAFYKGAGSDAATQAGSALIESELAGLRRK